MIKSMSVIHHRSQPVHDLIVKGLHDVKGTQVDCEANYEWQITQSQERAAASTAGGILSFLVPAATPGLITLWDSSYIEVKGYFTLAANMTAGTTKTSSVAALSNFIFSDYEISYNGTVVRPSTGFITPWGVFVDTILNENKAYIDNRQYSGGYIWDGFNQAGQDDPAVNLGFARRAAIFAGTAATSANRPFSLMIPLRSLGIRTSDAIPPGVEIRMRCTRSPSQMLTWGTDSSTTLATLTMNSCRLFMRQVRLTQEASAALSMSLQKEAARLNFQRVRMFSQYFALGTQEVFVNQALPGPRPSRVVCAYIPQNSLTDQAPNPLQVRPESGHVLSNTYLQIGDARLYPVQSYSVAANANVHNTLELAEMYSLYQSCCGPKDAALPDEQFSNMMWLCFSQWRCG